LVSNRARSTYGGHAKCTRPTSHCGHSTSTARAAEVLTCGHHYLSFSTDNATSELLPSGSDETLLTSLQLSDQIRSKSVDASYALKSLRRRTGHKNPNVQIQALHVLDVLVKNSGEAFLLAVGNSKDGWMVELEELCKSVGRRKKPPNDV
jgi:hypothetical protein